MKKIFENWFKNYKLHLLIWLLFIFYETVVIGLISGAFGHPLTYAAHYLAAIMLFYLHADRLLPWAMSDKRYIIWKLLLIFSAEITGFVVISYILDKFLITSQIILYDRAFNLSYLYSLKMLYRGIYFLGFATGYYYLITYNKERKKTNELEKQHLKHIINSQKAEQELVIAQNAFLKAQINPHFLFNTLDFIYHNIDTLSPVAADAVIVLTEMMRYAVDADKMGDSIRLGDEIEQAENLLYLSQMRKDHVLGIMLDYTNEVRELELIPLVLLTLVENILKHGNLNEPQQPAKVSLHIEDHYFYLQTDNLVHHQPSNSSHNGLKNIYKRLMFAYGEAVEFDYYTDDADHFKARLRIPLEKLKAHAASSKVLPGTGTRPPHEYAERY